VLAIGAGRTAFGQEPKASADKAATVDIGIPESIFQGVPMFLRGPLSDPFKKMMKEQTGFEGRVHHLRDPMTVADQLDSGKLQLAVFQGHEFAWAKAKYKDLTPLVAILPNQPPTQAYLLVRWDCKAKSLGDLKDEILILPPGMKDPAKLFLEQQKKAYLGAGNFKAILSATSVRDAIHDVIEKKAAVTCVDALGFEDFQATFPGPFKNLRILAKSEIFPQACIAIKKGQLDDRTAKKFQDTLLKAADLEEGKRMMTLWKLQRFEPVPAAYEKQLTDCNKTYPFKGAPTESKDK
jgi:ABC-type phosphate/phosphonate transport system substrate-binding protein